MLVINLLYLFEKNKPCFIHSSDGYTCLVVPIYNVHCNFSFFLECHISKCMCVRLHLDVKIHLENSCHHKTLPFAALDKSIQVINRHVQVDHSGKHSTRYLSLQHILISYTSSKLSLSGKLQHSCS